MDAFLFNLQVHKSQTGACEANYSDYELQLHFSGACAANYSDYELQLHKKTWRSHPYQS